MKWRNSMQIYSYFGITGDTDVPIILISAYDWADMEEEARKAGIDGFIPKPLFKSTLYRALKRFSGEAPDDLKDEAAAGEKTPLEGMRVLLAEDQPINAEIVAAILEDAGARVVFDRHCFGSIPGREVIELKDDEPALPQIVRHYMNTSECARYIADNKVLQRRETADRLAKEFKADGIIYEQMKYCDFWGFERALVSHIMSEEYGWPVLSIDRLYNAKGSGQLRTRFQAFVESLEIKKIQKAKKGGAK